MGVESWEIGTVDYHTAGEPFRIVPAPPFTIPGASVLERRERAPSGEADTLRRLLVNEPRGHADMYGGFIVPPNDPGAHFGVLFWHKDGFSTACGHGTIALGTWAVRSGLVRPADSGGAGGDTVGTGMADGDTDVVIDVPSGRVTARVATRGGRVQHTTFRSVPSWVVARGVEVGTADFGRLRVDVLWGGALYAALPARAAGLDVTPSSLQRLIAAGRQVKAALAGHPAACHPGDARLDGIYGTIFHEPVDPVDPQNGLPLAGALAQRNVTIFADGQVDRSPCGSGTAARVAALTDSGELKTGEVLDHFSIINSHFTATVVAPVGVESTAGAGSAAEAVPSDVESQAAVVVEVTGTAFPTGEGRFTLAADDGLGLGFALR
ncbi:proline racemase family protein [Specibacter sp. AOP5-B1-6]|uniref:proline racemase family protein n=1 Tax=Specibacter sp. AOP5-B1-6 TaxID=3457653 RepID=UPI00402B6EA6